MQAILLLATGLSASIREDEPGDAPALSATLREDEPLAVHVAARGQIRQDAAAEAPEAARGAGGRERQAAQCRSRSL